MNKDFLKMPLEQQLTILSQGADEILPSNELKEKLEISFKEKRPLRVKLGVDPTRPDLHLGHAVVLRKLRQFQDLGHQAVLIIGDFTTKIGDPSGRSSARPIISDKEIKKNSQTYLIQAEKILDRKKIETRYNSEWLKDINLGNLLGLLSTFTVAQMLEREDFKNRYKKGVEIFIYEFLYPLMQGYDSVAVSADIEIGGVDQKFNLLAGREVQKFYGQMPQVILTMPLLEGLDGVKKMSKSLDNYIGLDESSDEIFGKTMSLADKMIPKYFRLCANWPEEEIKKIEKDLKTGANPKEIKMKLAYEITKIYHGSDLAQKAQENFITKFSKKEIPKDLPETSSSAGTLFSILLQVAPETIKSNSVAKKLIEQGGVDVNGQVEKDPYFILEKDKEYILKIGKKVFKRTIPK